jgi:hypothetical protein
MDMGERSSMSLHGIYGTQVLYVFPEMVYDGLSSLRFTEITNNTLINCLLCMHSVCILLYTIHHLTYSVEYNINNK